VHNVEKNIEVFYVREQINIFALPLLAQGMFGLSTAWQIASALSKISYFTLFEKESE